MSLYGMNFIKDSKRRALTSVAYGSQMWHTKGRAEF